jgi:hypothetical protein
MWHGAELGANLSSDGGKLASDYGEGGKVESGVGVGDLREESNPTMGVVYEEN